MTAVTVAPNPTTEDATLRAGLRSRFQVIKRLNLFEDERSNSPTA